MEDNIKEIFDNFLIRNHEENNYFHNGGGYNYFVANYPDCILIEVEKGGSSGGNCWNDDPSEPYEKETYEIEKDIDEGLKDRIQQLLQDLNIDVNSSEYKRNLLSCVYSISKENEVHERSINEYYGNYRTEAIYAIKIKDILKEILKKEDFDILEVSLNEFILNKKPELLDVDQDKETKKINKRFK